MASESPGPGLPGNGQGHDGAREEPLHEVLRFPSRRCSPVDVAELIAPISACLWENSPAVRVSNCTSEVLSSETSEGNDVNMMQVLTTHIDGSVLRGVSVAVVLRNFGAAFRNHEFRQKDYVRSRPTAHLDDFVSHDWAAGRVSKALALCVLYNGWSAAIASLVAGVLVGVLQCDYWGLGVLPLPPAADETGLAPVVGIWCQMVCPVVFLLFLLFWQDLRLRLHLGTKLVFVDKFCIDQEDAARKAAGILGLGGFLRHTRRFLVCWTPRYFTRLWCTYEVAAWLHLRKPMDAIEFFPLSHAKALVAIGLCMCGSMLSFGIVADFLGRRAMTLAALANCLTLMPLAGHWFRRLVRDVQKLPAQLENFTVSSADCYCCAHKHRHPSRPAEEIPCDRQLVFRTLAAWFREADPVGTQLESSIHESNVRGLPAVEAFDRHVREVLAPWVLEQAGPTRLHYKYILLSGWPWVWRTCDHLATLGTIPMYQFWAWLFIPAQIGFVVLPVAYRAGLLAAVWLDARCGVPKSRCLDLLLTLGLTGFTLLVAAVLWLPMNMMASRQQPGWLITCMAANVLVTAAFFWSDLSGLLHGLGRLARRSSQHLPGPQPPPRPPVRQDDEDWQRAQEQVN